MQACQFTDDTVTDGHQYEYRVIARNAAGAGQPSDSSKPITAKPMKGMFFNIYCKTE